MTLLLNLREPLSGNEQIICIKTEIPEEICNIDDELKAIYHMFLLSLSNTFYKFMMFHLIPPIILES